MPYDNSLQRVWEALDRRAAFTNHEVVTVSFTTANADQDIRHSLTPASPEDIYYIPIKQSGSGSVYNDQSATRKVWQRGYIYLRCSTTITVTLLLVILR